MRSSQAGAGKDMRQAQKKCCVGIVALGQEIELEN